jgi:hypothetical protein
MKRKCLFVGGSADGKMIEVHDDTYWYKVPVMEKMFLAVHADEVSASDIFRVQEYHREIIHEDGAEFHLFVHGIRNVFAHLVEGYRKPI